LCKIASLAPFGNVPVVTQQKQLIPAIKVIKWLMGLYKRISSRTHLSIIQTFKYCLMDM